MPTLSPQSQNIINVFGQQPGVTPDQVNNLQTIINGSPALVDQINTAVAAGQLQKISPLTNTNAGGEYDPQNKAMLLPLDQITSPLTPDKIGNMTFVLGHELQHGPNQLAVARAETAFTQAVTNKAQEPGGRHDYTTILERRLESHRQNEAGAEIAGWNAVVSAVKAINPNPTLADIYQFKPSRMADFIDPSNTSPTTYTLKPNLTLNTDMTLSASAANLEAMGQNYFDKPARPAPLGIGHHGDSDYRNYYAASDVGYIVQVERHFNPPQPGVTPPTIAINMQQLKLSEAQMERNGIDLGSNHDRKLYRDTSTTPATAHHFDHTHSQATHPNDGGHQHVPISPLATGPDITDPAHPGHRRFQQAVQSMEHSPNILPGTFTGERLQQSAANLAYASLAGEERPGIGGRNESLARIDFVVFNKDRSSLIAGEGELGNPSAKLAWLSGAQDNNSSLIAASQRTSDLMQDPQKQVLANPALQQSIAQGFAEPEPAGPRR